MMKNIFDTPPELDHGMRVLALEALNLSNVIDSLSGVLPALVTKITDTVNSVISDQDADSRALNKAYGSLDHKLKLAKFIDYRKTIVSVPEGFSGHMTSYISLIAEHNITVYTDAIAVVKEYNHMLAVFISNKDAKIALKDETRFFATVDRNIRAINKDISVYFPGTTVNSKIFLGDIIERFVDIEELVHKAEAINKVYNAKNLNTFKDITAQSVDMLNIIIDSISKKGIESVSGNAARNIAEGAYEIARYAEFVAGFRYRTIQCTSAVNNLVDKLNEVMTG